MAAVRDAIVQHLQTDAGGVMTLVTAVWPQIPPEGEGLYPFVTVTAQKAPTGVHAFQNGGYEESVFLVKAIDRNTSPKKVGQIAAAIRARLEDAALTISGQSTLAVIWLMDVSYHEVEQGTIYQHEGGLYYVAAENA
jgi:hypothetical protein